MSETTPMLQDGTPSYDPPETVDDTPVAPLDAAHEAYDLHDADDALAAAFGGGHA
jgi:hypothetical protein